MSNSRSPTTGFGSIASQGSRTARRTLPLWKSWWATTSSPWERPRLPQERDRLVQQRPLVRTAVPLPGERQLVGPGGGEVGDDPEAVARGRRAPERAQHARGNAHRCRAVRLGPELRPRFAPLEEERAAALVLGEEPHRAFAVPECKRVRLALAFALREVELQHRGRTVREVRRSDPGDVAARVGLTDAEGPQLGALPDEPRAGAPATRRRPARRATGPARPGRSHAQAAQALAQALEPVRNPRGPFALAAQHRVRRAAAPGGRARRWRSG